MAEHLSLGGLIRRQREMLGLTQSRLAELVGRSPSTVRSWERDRSLPGDEDALFALGAVLGLSDDEMKEALGSAYPSFEADQLPLPQADVPGSGSDVPAPTDPPIESPPVASPAGAADLAETSAAETEVAGELPEQVPDAAALIETASADAAIVEDSGSVTEEDGQSPATVAESPVEDVEESDAGTESPETPAAPMPDPGNASPTVVDAPPAAPAEPYAPPPSPSRSPSTVAARPRVPSYMDDPGQARIYRMRAILTAVIIVLLFLVLTWAFGEARDALGSLFGS